MATDSRLTKRQLKKLVKEQTGLVNKDPNNLVARLKLAGALKDLGKDKEAVTHYQEVAQAYASSGKLVQAISVYKGILELKPGHEQTEAALSELSAQRAKEIKVKSMPRLQQQDDGRWVMPAESDVSEEEGTDPGAATQGKAVGTSPSVLRLPAPLPTDSLPPRRRRGRRSRPLLGEELPETSSSPSLDELEMPEYEAPDSVPSQPEGFQPSLPSLAQHEGAAAVPVPALPSHEPPARVPLPPESSPPPPPLVPSPRPSAVAEDGGSTAERDLRGIAALAPATATPQEVSLSADPEAAADLVLTAEIPAEQGRTPGDLLTDDDEPEDPTSPGPSGYTETIRKSAVSIDVATLAPTRQRAPVTTTPVRRTLVGVPTSETPDLPTTPLAKVPPPDERPTGEFESPLPSVTRSPRTAPTARPGLVEDGKRTVRMEREPDMAPPPPASTPAPLSTPASQPTLAPTPERRPIDEADDETLAAVFDDEEEAFWTELKEAQDQDGEPTETATEAPAAPVMAGPKVRQTLLTTPALRPATAPDSGAKPGGGAGTSPADAARRPDKAKPPRKSSKMTIPMGAAAFKKAADEAESDAEKDASPQAPAAAVVPQAVRLEEIALFRDLSETSRELLRSRLVRREEKVGTRIVREGDPGNALFVVSSGQVRVTKQDRDRQPVELAVLGPGAFFGEFALLSDRKRHATVTVSESGVFFEISRKVIADLTKSDPAFGNTLRQFYRRRLLGTLVRSAPFFEPLSEKEQEALMGRLRFRRIPEKTKIITEGEPGGGFFLILIGEVEVAKNQPDGSQKVLSRLADGSYFGEMSLLKGGNAVATVTTVTPTELVQLAAAEFYRILSKYPQIWEEVNREAKRRELANLQILSGRTPDSGPSDDSVVM